MLWALVPICRLDQAKQRLAPVLSASVREALAESMLRDLLDCLCRLPALDRRILLLSPDSRVANLAADYGLDFLRDRRGEELNASLERGRADLGLRGATRLMVCLADLPLARLEEFETLLGSGSSDVVIDRVDLVADRRGRGTNVFLAPAKSTIPFCFGEDSQTHFLAAARQLGIPTASINLPGLSFDVDLPEDLVDLCRQLALAAQHEAKWSRRVLEELSMAELHRAS